MLQESKKDVPVNNSELVEKKVTDDILLLREKKAEVALAQGRYATFIKDRVDKYKSEWWREWYKMLKSDEKDLKKTAIVEYNKLQGRILPTQLEGTNGQQIVVNVVGLGIDSPGPITIEGDCVDNN